MDYTAYPPIIDGSIPAFVGHILKVPITHNPAVNLNSVVGYSLKLRYVNNTLMENDQHKSTIEIDGAFLESDSIPFDLWGNKELIGSGYFYPNSFTSYNLNNKTYPHPINMGDYFKVQVAYIFQDGNAKKIGHYSSVAITKRTAEPTIEISNLKTGLNRLTKTQSFEGVYITNDKDPDERLYSWEMKLFDEDDNVIDSSGERLFFASQNRDQTSQAVSHTFYNSIEENKIYKIQFFGTTVNGYRSASNRYQLMEINTKQWSLGARFWAEMNSEYGYISLSMKDDEADDKKWMRPGKYFITRESSKDNYSTLLPIGTVTVLTNYVQTVPEFFRDYNIEQGISYKYYLQQFNNYKIYSSPIYASSTPDVVEESPAEIYCDFEDAFLYDGERQLRIRFNPSVSSFKTTKLEQKTDTIGGKYPFFFSNRQIGYKEFPIGGLISYHMDEQFCTKEELGLDEQIYTTQGLQDKEKRSNRLPTTNLVNYSVAAERNFKLKVLDWLNDGKYKLFKSPTEGNYLVRLMNVSLTPNEQLGRMLHSFSATAYECLDNTYENLINYGFHKLAEVIEYTDINASFLIKDLVPNEQGWYIVTPSKVIVKELVCRDFQEGDQIKISYSNGEEANIVIGPIGGYQLRSINNLSIERVMVKKLAKTEIPMGAIEYVALVPVETEYDRLKDVKFHTLIAKKYKKLEGNPIPIATSGNSLSYYIHQNKRISKQAEFIDDKGNVEIKEIETKTLDSSIETSIYWEVPEKLNEYDLYTFEIKLEPKKQIEKILTFDNDYNGGRPDKDGAYTGYFDLGNLNSGIYFLEFENINEQLSNDPQAKIFAEDYDYEFDTGIDGKFSKNNNLYSFTFNITEELSNCRLWISAASNYLDREIPHNFYKLVADNVTSNGSYIETYEGVEYPIGDINPVKDSIDTITFVLNIAKHTTFKRGMIHLAGEHEIKSWAIYANKDGSLTNEIRKEFPNADILKMYLIQFIVEDTMGSSEGCNVTFDNIDLKLPKDLLYSIEQQKQFKEEEFVGSTINLYDRRHLDLYLNLADDEEAKVLIPNITMGSKVTAYITALLQQEVYENA